MSSNFIEKNVFRFKHFASVYEYKVREIEEVKQIIVLYLKTFKMNNSDFFVDVNDERICLQ